MCIQSGFKYKSLLESGPLMSDRIVLGLFRFGLKLGCYVLIVMLVTVGLFGFRLELSCFVSDVKLDIGW